MLLELDNKNDYQSSKVYEYKVNDHKSIIIDTYSNGDITMIWLFDYSKNFGDRVIAYGYTDDFKMLPNITEVINADTEVLNTDLLIRVADKLIEGRC